MSWVSPLSSVFGSGGSLQPQDQVQSVWWWIFILYRLKVAFWCWIFIVLKTRTNQIRSILIGSQGNDFLAVEKREREKTSWNPSALLFLPLSNKSVTSSLYTPKRPGVPSKCFARGKSCGETTGYSVLKMECCLVIKNGTEETPH
jgi:hypothetical protein